MYKRQVPDGLAYSLKEIGFDQVNMASNHAMDAWHEGIVRTLDVLDDAGLEHVGAYRTQAERDENNGILVEELNGISIAFLNYTYGTNGIPVPEGVRVNLIDTVRMAADLAAAREGSPDCIAVCIHWGNEYERQANAEQRRLARFLRRNGADLIVGSHPHVVQPFETDSSHVVLYSLGNFVSNQRRRYCDGGLVAEIEAVRHPDGRMSYSLEAVPVWVAMPGYRVVPSEVGDTMALPEAYALFREDVAEVLGGAYK